MMTRRQQFRAQDLVRLYGQPDQAHESSRSAAHVVLVWHGRGLTVLIDRAGAAVELQPCRVPAVSS